MSSKPETVDEYFATLQPEQAVELQKVESYCQTESMLEFKYADGMPVELIEEVAREMALPPGA